ncbi:Protein NLP3, partial [Bienertia sinuspersici]
AINLKSSQNLDHPIIQDYMSVLAYDSGVKISSSSFDGSCMGKICMSTTNVAFYVVDAHTWHFREAYVEHHLQKGIEYPLMNYAHMFKLIGSFAICLRSKYTGDDKHILKLFFPLILKDFTEQFNLLDSILATMKQDFRI